VICVIEVRRKEGESSESLLRRFTKQVQQSRILIHVKRSRFYEPPKNKREIRESAKRRQKVKAQKEYLRKIGKLDDLYEQKRRSYRR
jgi:ribosomal protein S21